MDADVGAGAEFESFHELEELGIFFEDAQDFVGSGDFGVGQSHRAEFAAEFGHTSEERNPVGAANVAAKAFQQEVGNFGRNAVLEAFGFFVSAGPIDADHFGKKFFGEAMAEDEMLRDSLPFCGEGDAAVTHHAEVAGARHAF
jgi:hypothetical protein